MSMTTIAVSSAETRIGSGRAGSVTTRPFAIPASTRMPAPSSAECPPDAPPAQVLAKRVARAGWARGVFGGAACRIADPLSIAIQSDHYELETISAGADIMATLARPAVPTLSLVLLVATAILLNYVDRGTV